LKKIKRGYVINIKKSESRSKTLQRHNTAQCLWTGGSGIAAGPPLYVGMQILHEDSGI